MKADRNFIIVNESDPIGKQKNFYLHLKNKIEIRILHVFWKEKKEIEDSFFISIEDDD